MRKRNRPGWVTMMNAHTHNHLTMALSSCAWWRESECTHRLKLDARRGKNPCPTPERAESFVPIGGAPAGAAAGSAGTARAARSRVVRIAATTPERTRSGDPEL